VTRYRRQLAILRNAPTADVRHISLLVCAHSVPASAAAGKRFVLNLVRPRPASRRPLRLIDRLLEASERLLLLRAQFASRSANAWRAYSISATIQERLVARRWARLYFNAARVRSVDLRFDILRRLLSAA